MTMSAHRRRLIALCVAALLGLVAVLIAESDAATVEASNSFQANRQHLDRELATAQAQGFSQDDLRPVLDRLAGVDRAPQPVWVGDRPAYYHAQGLVIVQLRAQLGQQQQAVLGGSKDQALKDLGSTKAQIDQDSSLGLDAGDVAALQARYDDLNKAIGDGHTLLDFRSADGGARTLTEDATKAAAVQQAENAVLLKAAADLKAQKSGSVPALAKAGSDALATGRNEATYAGFLNQAGTFNGYDSVARAYRALERYAGQLSASDADAAALAAGAELRYAAQIHDALVKGMPGKAILVSLNEQELRAYENGKAQPVLATVVTTGRPALPTDVGPMKVLWKVTPWKMVSPWPQGSPFYYPPTDVRKVLWFTASGEGLHDASWRSWFGPGSNSGDGTHGCINLPGSTVDFVYDWAPVGTPVIVIPGNGQPQAQQLAADTIDTNAGQAVKGA
jgi:lipoprotein-anchoring transpeptidase ErfK/SrfK